MTPKCIIYSYELDLNEISLTNSKTTELLTDKIDCITFIFRHVNQKEYFLTKPINSGIYLYERKRESFQIKLSF
jgi:hypothetical protein